VGLERKINLAGGITARFCIYGAGLGTGVLIVVVREIIVGQT